MSLPFRISTILRPLALSLSLLAAPALAEEQMTDYASTRDWTVFSITENGNFLRCAAVHPEAELALERQDDGFYLSVELGGAPEEVAATFDVDKASFEGTFFLQPNGRHHLWLDEGMVESLKAGDRLILNLPGGDSTWSLKGTVAAMLKADECYASGAPAAAQSGLTDSAGESGLDDAMAPGEPVAPVTMDAQVENDAARLGKGCPKPFEFRSEASDKAAMVTFVNGSDIAVTAYWLDLDGNIVDYAGILPGESLDQATFVGHYWLLKDFNSECHGGAIRVSKAAETITVK